MSIKTSGRFSAFFVLSLAVHAAAIFLFIYAQTHKAAPVVKDDGKEPVFVDVVDLPPWFKGGKEAPRKPSMMSDRTIVAEKETVTEGAAKAGSAVKAAPAAKKKGEKSGKEKPLALKNGKGKEKKEPVFKMPGKTGKEAVEPKPIKKPEEERKRESIEESKDTKTPVLFPSGERLSELSKVYEAESPKGEKGKTLSINTAESKYQKYLLNMKRRIELFWSYPESSIRSGEQGKMRIDFIIAKDGSVKDVRVVKSSNYPALDDAAITAVKLASPFNPFPKDFDIETVEIHASFEYSLIF